MRPVFRITADGDDITVPIADRLLSLTITDEDGVSADRFEMVLDDRDARLALPEPGARIEIALGLDGVLTEMGTYTADRISGKGPARELTVRGLAADMAGPLRSPQTRAWEAITLGELIERLAQEAGLAPVVAEELGDSFYPYLAQTAESPLNLLSRLAADLDATVKPAGGRLVVAARASGTTAEGDPVPEIVLPLGALDSWSWSLGERNRYRTVKAKWSDIAGGSEREVAEGDGDPVKTLRHTFASEAEARRAAKAHLTMAERGALSISSRCAFTPTAFAGASVVLSGLRAELDGTWRISRVEHRLSGSGLSTGLSAEKAFEPSAQEQPAAADGEVGDDGAITLTTIAPPAPPPTLPVGGGVALI